MTLTEVTIRTRRVTKGLGQYYRGFIKRGYSLGELVYYLDCQAYAGGGRKVSLASVDNFRAPLKRQLIKKLEGFARGQRYVITFKTVVNES